MRESQQMSQTSGYMYVYAEPKQRNDLFYCHHQDFRRILSKKKSF